MANAEPRILMSAPSLHSILDWIDQAIAEPVMWAKPIGEGVWALLRRDDSVIDGFVIRETGKWDFRLEDSAANAMLAAREARS